MEHNQAIQHDRAWHRELAWDLISTMAWHCILSADPQRWHEVGNPRDNIGLLLHFGHVGYACIAKTPLDCMCACCWSSSSELVEVMPIIFVCSLVHHVALIKC